MINKRKRSCQPERKIVFYKRKNIRSITEKDMNYRLEKSKLELHKEGFFGILCKK